MPRVTRLSILKHRVGCSRHPSSPHAQPREAQNQRHGAERQSQRTWIIASIRRSRAAASRAVVRKSTLCERALHLIARRTLLRGFKSKLGIPPPSPKTKEKIKGNPSILLHRRLRLIRLFIHPFIILHTHLLPYGRRYGQERSQCGPGKNVKGLHVPHQESGI